MWFSESLALQHVSGTLVELINPACPLSCAYSDVALPEREGVTGDPATGTKGSELSAEAIMENAGNLWRDGNVQCFSGA